VKYIVVNTTTTAQLPPLLALTAKYPTIIVPAFGVHPYFVSQQESIEDNKKHQENKLSWA
jgi:Tat protein secretion system quality control protein TatD with DNase activity